MEMPSNGNDPERGYRAEKATEKGAEHYNSTNLKRED